MSQIKKCFYIFLFSLLLTPMKGDVYSSGGNDKKPYIDIRINPRWNYFSVHTKSDAQISDFFNSEGNLW